MTNKGLKSLLGITNRFFTVNVSNINTELITDIFIPVNDNDHYPDDAFITKTIKNNIGIEFFKENSIKNDFFLKK